MKHFVAPFLFLLFFLSSSAQKRIDFTPTLFYHIFSGDTLPVLKISPGDTVHTESVDAMGIDKHGVRRVRSGNPLTGPFYIETAEPGDVIAITLTKLSLNRSYANSAEGFVPRALPKSDLVKSKKVTIVKWNFDLQKMTATPEVKHEHLQHLTVPLNPMLGCVGLASAGNKKILTFDAGPFGGNMDFSRIAQGATIYLPVFHQGGLLYIGDGHAMQADAELNGDALETSMDIEFTTRVLRDEQHKISMPMVEDSMYIMCAGLDKSLDNALKIANAGMMSWLQKNYHLSYEEVTIFLGSVAEYTIAEVADPKVEVIAKIRKKFLNF
ncbi:MAG: acetamidase/formamidase family protein [Bacteroidetes bacterium]|nr:acetamidase/formamidase family protein [Bacteroidota bacterium]